METIRLDVEGLKEWRGVTEHRVERLEKERQEDVKEVAQLKNEVVQVDRKVSNIETGISFLKWSIPVSISVAMAIGGLIAWIINMRLGV